MWFTNGVPYQLWLDLYDQLAPPAASNKKNSKKCRWLRWLRWLRWWRNK